MIEQDDVRDSLDMVHAALSADLAKQYPNLDKSETLIIGTVLMAIGQDYIQASGQDPIEFLGASIDRIRMERKQCKLAENAVNN